MPSPLPNNIDTFPERVPGPFAVARSGLPSALKSPTAKEYGLSTAADVRAAAKLGVRHSSANASSLRNKPVSRMADTITVNCKAEVFTISFCADCRRVVPRAGQIKRIGKTPKSPEDSEPTTEPLFFEHRGI